MTKSSESNKADWEEISDSYAQTTSETIGPVLHPNRETTTDDLDDIFASVKREELKGIPVSAKFALTTTDGKTHQAAKATMEAMQYAQERANGKVPDDSPTFTNAADTMAYLNQKADHISD